MAQGLLIRLSAASPSYSQSSLKKALLSRIKFDRLTAAQSLLKTTPNFPERNSSFALILVSNH